jgi:hypothetical protein
VGSAWSSAAPRFRCEARRAAGGGGPTLESGVVHQRGPAARA